MILHHWAYTPNLLIAYLQNTWYSYYKYLYPYLQNMLQLHTTCSKSNSTTLFWMDSTVAGSWFIWSMTPLINSSMFPGWLIRAVRVVLKLSNTCSDVGGWPYPPICRPWKSWYRLCKPTLWTLNKLTILLLPHIPNWNIVLHVHVIYMYRVYKKDI